jgi:hypothetical protein
LKKDSFFAEGTICSHGKKIEPVAGVWRICSRCRMPQPLSTLVSWWWDGLHMLRLSFCGCSFLSEKIRKGQRIRNWVTG